MTNHVLLDNITHKSLRISKSYKAGTGFDVNVARVFPAEFGRLQREYPLFFVKNNETGDFDSIALLGFAEKENLYLSDDGWTAAYIPLTIERQPFLIGYQEQEIDGTATRTPVVFLDEDHPSVSETEGEAVFLPQGGESPYLEHINRVLATINQGHSASQAYSRLLVGLELIESLSMEVEFRDGSKHRLTGLHTINEDRLGALSGDALETLHRAGHLQSVYMMLASLLSMESLIERKNRLLEG